MLALTWLSCSHAGFGQEGAKSSGTVEVSEDSGRKRVASGIVVSENGHVLVASAFADGARSISIKSPTGAKLPAELETLDKNAGIAILRVPDLRGVRPIHFALESASIGDRISTLPSDEGPRVPGAINSALRYNRVRYFKHNATLPGRFYGSPIVNDCNELIGINVVDPSVSPRRARSLPEVGAQAHALGKEGIATILSANSIQFVVSASPCLSLEEQARLQEEIAESEAGRAEEAEAEARERQDAIDRAREELEQKQADARAAEERALAAQAEADRRAQELEVVTQDRNATEAERRQAEEAAEEARKLAEAAALDAEELSQEIATLNEQAGFLQERLENERVRFWIVLAGVGVLAIGGVLIVRGMLRRRRLGLEQTEKKWQSAEARLAESFSDIEFRGKDESGAPFAFVVSGAALLKSPEGVVVGRQPQSAKIVLNHPEVSRAHALIVLRSNTAFIEDLGSTNGTALNGRNLSEGEEVALAPGDTVDLGKIRFVVRFLDV